MEQEREVAGIGIMLRPKDNVPFAAAIDTLSALMGSIAESLDLYTVEPSNSTKTVLIPLRFAPDRMSAYNSVEVFPSGDAPQIVIRMILDNGEEKTLYVATVRTAARQRETGRPDLCGIVLFCQSGKSNDRPGKRDGRFL